MKINKIFFFLILSLLIFTKSLALENKIIVKIENEIITTIDIKKEYLYLLALNPGLNKLDDKEILEISKKSLINEKIKNIEILNNTNNLNIPDEYLEKILKNIYKKIGINNLNEFKSYLKIKDIEYNDVVRKITIEALWNELIITKFSSMVKINEEKIKKKINLNNKKLLKSYLLSEIFFEVINKEQLLTKYNEIQKTIKDKGFANAALKYSISESANTGGKLDWIKESSLNKIIKDNLDQITTNEYTKPIAVPGGFIILKINQIKTDKISLDLNKEFSKEVNYIRNYQLNQFSKIHFNKVKKNIQIYE